MLPHMAVSGDRVLVHYPAVGAESELLPLAVPIIDGDLRQAIILVELTDHILAF